MVDIMESHRQKYPLVFARDLPSLSQLKSQSRPEPADLTTPPRYKARHRRPNPLYVVLVVAGLLLMGGSAGSLITVWLSR